MANHEVFQMEIIDFINSFYIIRISTPNESTIIKFNPENKELKLNSDNLLDQKLLKFQYQLRKILNNKRADTFLPKFKLKFVLRDNHKAIEFNNLSKIIVLDRRNNAYETYAKEKSKKEIFQIFTDGCYLEKKQKAAYVAITKDLNHKLYLYYGKTDTKSSSLTELLAVIKGLEVSKNIQKIRIVSDSRYIIKGLTEWVFNWKLNNWYTAQGEKVKNIEHWKYFDELSKGKYIEFEWVKARAQHPENTLCDFYAKQVALK